MWVYRIPCMRALHVHVPCMCLALHACLARALHVGLSNPLSNPLHVGLGTLPQECKHYGRILFISNFQGAITLSETLRRLRHCTGL